METQSMEINKEYKVKLKQEKVKLKNKEKLQKLKMKSVKEYDKHTNTKSKKSKKIKKKKPKATKNLLRIINKRRRWEPLFKYEEEHAKKKLIEKADIVFSRFIRERDRWKHCISNWATGCTDKIENNCHWIGRGYYSHRRDEMNCNGGCVSCNAHHKQEHGIYYTAEQIRRHWQERVDEQLKQRHKHKPTIEQLIKLIEKYDKY